MKDPSAEVLREMASRLRSAGAPLRAHGLTRRAEALAALAGELVAHARKHLEERPDPTIEALAAGAGLSPAMTAWALETTARRYEATALVMLARAASHEPLARSVPAGLVVVVLAGNVFTAALRAIALPLLVGAPVLAKAPSRDDQTLRRIARTLGHIDPVVGAALAIVSYRGGDDPERDGALVASADAVSIYGTDETIAKLRARASAGTRVIAHGHGLGLGLVTPRALDGGEEALETLVRGLALDVAAYDGRGCLSPLAVLVPGSAAVAPERLAGRLLAAGIDLARTLPRAPLPDDGAAAQAQWRAVAAARGTLLEAADVAVAIEPTLRPSPGWRNVALVPYERLEDALGWLAAFGAHLKVVGVPAGEPLEPLARALPASVAPRLCVLGTMQDPPLDALDDGLPPLDGLVRHVELRA